MQKLFVGNLPFQTTEMEIRNSFERYGKVAFVQLMSDRQTGRSRGFAFVGMPQLDDADEARVRLNGSYLNGRRMTVVESQQKLSEKEPATASRWHLV